ADFALFSCKEGLKHFAESLTKTMPYDANRVHLPSGEYLNGSYITAQGKHFIAIETPKMNESEKFWELVASHEVELIVTLGDDAANFFPEKREMYIAGPYGIKCLHEKIHKISETEFIKQRYYLTTDGSSRSSIIELAYISNDEKEPSSLALAYLQKKMHKLSPNRKTPLIHTQSNMRAIGALVAACVPSSLTAIETQRHNFL
ncbi:MAG: protein-tyrosine phosphatase family protein, partial [Simkaniaceae bacterium]|nr:protein-tyrosine phosphatase family protein [Simkaniaceae bacterium]